MKDSPVEEKHEFEVDLRIEGIAHDVFMKDEERMGQVQDVVENCGKAHTRNLCGKIWENEETL